MSTRYAIRTAMSLALMMIGAAKVHAGVGLESFGIGPAGGTQLFRSTGPQGAPGPDAGPGATVAWPVTVDLALLNTLPETVTVNFPDRDSVTLTRMRSERRGSGFMWSGRGGDCSGLFREASGDTTAGGFKGLVACLNAPYGVDHAPGSASLRLSRYDDAGHAINDEGPPSPPGRGSVQHCHPLPPGGPDPTVDVLVLFNGSLTGIDDWQYARDLVMQIQMAMDNSSASGAPIAEIRLAGAALISRTVSNDPSGDLADLPHDAEVEALRDYYAADAVIYITTGTGPLLGIARLPGADPNSPCPGPAFAPFAYAVALVGYAINPGDFVGAHEFAHTFGANHNPDHPPVNPTPVEDFAFGHWGILNDGNLILGKRTLMSYPQECFAAAGHACPRIPNYSNPDVSVLWFQTGIAGQRDNASLIAEIAPIEAQYRAGRIFADGFDGGP